MFNIWVSGFCALGALNSFLNGHIVLGVVNLVLSVLNFYAGYRGSNYANSKTVYRE